MPAESSTKSEPDEADDRPLRAEAIGVVATTADPALVDLVDYPYAARPSAALVNVRALPVARLRRGRFFWLGKLRFESPLPAQYVVPQRFGMSAIIGITTALAVLFGALRVLDADPVVYLFFGLQAVVICLVQMFNGRAPRLASSITGAILAPLFIVQLLDAADILLRSGPERAFLIGVFLVCAIPFGAFLGYLTGTCAAGVFLVLEKLENYLRQRLASRLSTGTLSNE